MRHVHVHGVERGLAKPGAQHRPICLEGDRSNEYRLFEHAGLMQAQKQVGELARGRGNARGLQGAYDAHAFGVACLGDLKGRHLGRQRLVPDGADVFPLLVRPWRGPPALLEVPMLLIAHGNRDHAAAQWPEVGVAGFRPALIHKLGKQAVRYDGKSFHEPTIIQIQNEV